jgi:ribosome biogenesis GTPase
MREGRITKGIGGFYYVMSKGELIECRARGLFREMNITPLTGDRVKIRVDKDSGSGYIEEILERSSVLLRPPVANVSQAVIVVSTKDPEPNLWLVDKMVIMAEEQDLNVIFCINKCDIDIKRAEELKNIYLNAGFIAILTSTKTGVGISDLKEYLHDNTSVFAGASGSGKSSLLNSLDHSFKLQTSHISRKTARGRHTTRHVELLSLDVDSYVLDTPGFSSLSLDFVEDPVDLRDYYREFSKFAANCKFLSCLHDSEPGCAVKQAVLSGTIGEERYKNYLAILEELRKRRKY